MTTGGRKFLLLGAPLGCAVVGVGVAAWASRGAVPGWAWAVAIAIAAAAGAATVTLIERPWRRLAERARDLGVVPRTDGADAGPEAAVTASG